MIDEVDNSLESKVTSWIKNKYIRYAAIAVGGFILLLMFKLPLLMFGLGWAMCWLYTNAKKSKKKESE